MGRLVLGAVALGVIAWHDGVAGWCGMLAVRLFWGRFLGVEDRGGLFVVGNRENCVGVFERGHSRRVFVRIEAGR